MDPDDIPTSITRETYTITRSLIADGLPVLSQNQTAMLLAHFWPAIEQHVRGQIAAEIRQYCPDHGTADTCRMDCHCAIADELTRPAAVSGA